MPECAGCIPRTGTAGITPALCCQSSQELSDSMRPDPPTRDTPLFIVINAASGSADARTECERIEATLREAGQRHTVFAVEDPSELPTIARRAADEALRHQGAVVVAGGDGTINAVLQAAL